MAVVPAEIKKYNDGSRIDRRNDNMKKWIPVSYTHLDVYKRQGYGINHEEEEGGED